MNPVRELPNRYRWHPELDIEGLTLHYYDRVNSSEKVLTGSDVADTGDIFMFLKDGRHIPYHRVVRIKYRGKTIFERK